MRNRKSPETVVSVIVVSYNTADLIGACLNSVMAAGGPPMEVFVVDNASVDQSVDLVVRDFSSVHLIANRENKGFAAANNQALALCQGRYIYFLNPDTRVEPGAVRRVVSFMDANTHIGLAGTRIINPDGSLQESISYRYPGQKYASSELRGLKGTIACVLGASMMARSDVIRAVGGFDEGFFLYGEDQDLCLRVRDLGHEIGYVDSAVVVHLGGQSERRSTSCETWRRKVSAEYRFYRKHYRPETIERIRRADRLKACWRIATLKLTLPLLKDKHRAREKLVKYQVIYDATTNHEA